MKAASSCSVLLLLLTFGCLRTARMYPVSGPILNDHPQIIIAEFKDYGSGNGEVTVKLPDGELLQGEYSTVPQGSMSFSTSSSNGMVSASGSGIAITAFDWSNTYGNSFSVANMQCGQATCIGNKGTALSVEYAVSAMTGHGYGIGKDNKGNIYRIQF